MYTVGITKVLIGSLTLLLGLIVMAILMSKSPEYIGAAVIHLILPALLVITVIDVVSGIHIMRKRRINLIIFIYNIAYFVLAFSVFVYALFEGIGSYVFGLICFGLFVFPYLLCVSVKIHSIRVGTR